MKTNGARHDREKIARRELQRDKEFQLELQKAYGVEKAPRSYHRALEKTFQELPPELIYHPRPLRSFARGLAAVAAVFVVLCGALFGLNAAKPQYAESLPGLGGFFAEINQRLGREVPDLPSPPPGPDVPAPTPDPEEGVSSYGPSEVEGDGFQDLPVEDNGVIFQSFGGINASYIVTMELPYIGRQSENLLNYKQPLLLGTFATATFEDGKEIPLGYGQTAESNGNDPTIDMPDWELNEGRFHAEWYAPEFAEQDMTITLYELGVWQDAEDHMIEELLGVGKRVVAEFTIRSDGAVEATDHYREKGLEKVPWEELRDEKRAPGFWNGWLAGESGTVSLSAVGGLYPDYYDMYYKVEVFSEKPYAVATLNCYLDGDLKAQVTNYQWNSHFDASEAGGVYVDSNTFLDEQPRHGSWCGLDTVFWMNMVTDEKRTGRQYGRTVFALPTTLFGVESGLDAASETFGRISFELVDQDGKVLISDFAQAHAISMEEVLEQQKAASRQADGEEALPSPTAPTIEN